MHLTVFIDIFPYVEFVLFECEVISRHCSVEEILCGQSLRGFALILFFKAIAPI